MAKKPLQHIANLQRQIQSRSEAMAQFIESHKSHRSKSDSHPRTVLARALKGTVIKIQKDGSCSCHDLDTGEKYKC